MPTVTLPSSGEKQHFFFFFRISVIPRNRAIIIAQKAQEEKTYYDSFVWVGMNCTGRW